MTTFKAEVYKHHKKEDGTYNVKIRVTHNRKKKYIATTKFLTKDDLTKGLKIKNQNIIDDLDDDIKKYRNICNSLGERGKTMDVEQIVRYIETYKGNDEHFVLDFVQYGREKVKELERRGRNGSASGYTTAINVLVQFAGRESIAISEITVKFLGLFAEWIESRPSRPNRKKGNRAVSLYLSAIRALHNMAKIEFNDEDAGVIRIPLSPFSKYIVPKPPTTKKRALSAEIIREIARTPYHVIIQPGVNRFNFAKDLFLLSFGLIGMNAVDLFNCDSISGNRITYCRTKTKNRRADNAEISIRIEPEIMPLVEKYRDKTGKRVFDFYQMYKTSGTFSYAINSGLKGIGKLECVNIEKLEFYAARHSWATIATNDCRINKYTVHTALNHVDETMKTTDIYIAKDFTLIDDANREVLDYMKITIGSVVEPKREG